MLDFRQSYCIQTNASFHGFGAVPPDDWFAGSWAASPGRRRQLTLISISRVFCWSRYPPVTSFKYQFFPIFISDRRFSAVWSNKRVFVETENTQALLFINKGTCKNPIAMSWLREIFCLNVRHNIHLREHHFPG